MKLAIEEGLSQLEITRHCQLSLGEKLLRGYMDNPGFNGMEVVATKLPLSMPLISPDGQVTDFQLVGAADLLLKDQLGRLFIKLPAML